MMGEDTVTLARKLNRPWSTVSSNINGYRGNAQVRQDIARFLGEAVEDLFPGEAAGP